MADREEMLEHKKQKLEKTTKRLREFAKQTGATFEEIDAGLALEDNNDSCIVCPPHT